MTVPVQHYSYNNNSTTNTTGGRIIVLKYLIKQLNDIDTSLLFFLLLYYYCDKTRQLAGSPTRPFEIVLQRENMLANVWVHFARGRRVFEIVVEINSIY